MDGTVEARPEMKDLLDRVRRGETLTITEGGRPVARLTPQPLQARQPRSEAEIKDLVARFEEFASRHTLGGLTLRELIVEGRR